MDRPDLRILLKLNAMGSAARAARSILEGAGDRDPLEASSRDWAAWAELAEAEAELLLRKARAFDADRELEKARRLGVAVVTGFPDLLEAIDDAPLVLYVQGELPRGASSLAFVGSRRPTPYGRRMSRSLAGAAAARGAVIVSGLAWGIDTECHRAALNASGRTWAVLGSGLDRVYPADNAALAREIVAQGGCLISEYPFQAPPLSHHFPRRNRIVSGLSWGTVVVEGEIKSGSLITAKCAAEQGRAVFAVPGPADSPLSTAPHRLIAQGAKLACRLEDVLEDLPPGFLLPEPGVAGEGVPPPIESGSGWPEPAAEGPAPAIKESWFAKQKNKILELVRFEARTVEELAAETGLAVPDLSASLVELELEDLVQPVEGQRYAKR